MAGEELFQVVSTVQRDARLDQDGTQFLEVHRVVEGSLSGKCSKGGFKAYFANLIMGSLPLAEMAVTSTFQVTTLSVVSTVWSLRLERIGSERSEFAERDLSSSEGHTRTEPRGFHFSRRQLLRVDIQEVTS